MTILRRLRGALGMAVAWGTLFATLSATFMGIVVGFSLIPPGILTPQLAVAALVRAFILGGIAGLAFALALSRGERRSSVSTLSSRRVARGDSWRVPVRFPLSRSDLDSPTSCRSRRGCFRASVCMVSLEPARAWESFALRARRRRLPTSYRLRPEPLPRLSP